MSYSFWRPPTLAPGGACPPAPSLRHCVEYIATVTVNLDSCELKDYLVEMREYQICSKVEFVLG